MAQRMVCDNCDNPIDEAQPRWHLNIYVPSESDSPFRSVVLDLCSKKCVNEADKDMPEDVETA